MDDYQDKDMEQIAIIGMAGRFPDARNIDQFWQNLRNGKESISIFTDEELLARGVLKEEFSHPNYVNAGVVLDDIDLFDADFFGCNTSESEMMDPQQRVFLEIAWESLENAGCNPYNFEGSIGVFGGAARNDYRKRIAADFDGITSGFDAFQSMLSNEPDYITTRVSYKLNLKGPSFTIQTACSTSLVAVHIACQNLLTYQCDMALAGGVCIRLPQGIGYKYVDGMIWSPDGHCRAFDAEAHGTILGHGAGIVVLKRLSEALEERDSIQAVIKGTSINNDGSLKVGFTAPSVDGQAEAISMAQEISNVTPDTITYIETHGTGTQLGDPVEVEALTKAFRAGTDKTNYCAIGSVKTNIGHLDAAAGIAGLIKTTLALKNKEIPPSLHYNKPNPNINFETSPFYVNTQLQEWECNNGPRRAAVSSFGLGGTNAHAILEEAPTVTETTKTRSCHLLLLSAKTQTALSSITTNLADYLRNKTETNLADVAFTLQTGRKYFKYRRFAVCKDVAQAVKVLSPDGNVLIAPGVNIHVDDIVFMFSGQGSQYVMMGHGLYKEEPVFKECVDHCSEILKSFINLDLRDILYPLSEKAVTTRQQMNQTYLTQPSLFVIEYALAKLWQSWGITPKAFVGHSIGEYVAACLSGVFSLEDALDLVAARGGMMQDLEPGAMLAVPLSEEDLRPLLPLELSIAVINAPTMTVISGENKDIDSFEKKLIADKGLECRRLHTSHAFHSKMMDPILDKFAQKVASVNRNKPKIPFVSNVSGILITNEEALSPEYWAKHLRQPVRFFSCMSTLLEEKHRLFLEIGPGHVLKVLTRQHPKSKGHTVMSSTRRPDERKDDISFILSTLGQLWMAGTEINWTAFYHNKRPGKIPLPTYPFERKRYWLEEIRPICNDVNDLKKEGHATLVYSEADKQDNIYKKNSDAHEFVQLQTNTEKLLTSIWHKIIPGAINIEAEDNFFSIGGDSLLAVQLLNELEKETGISLPLIAIYKTPTLGEFSRVVDEKISPPKLDKIIETVRDSTEVPSSMVVSPQINLRAASKKLKKALQSPFQFFLMLKAMFIGMLYICWYRLCRRNVQIKFPFYVYSRFKIIGPGNVYIDSGCSVFLNALEHTTIVTMRPESVVRIGGKCGLAGLTIRCNKRIEIGDRVMTAGNLIQDFQLFSEPDRLFENERGASPTIIIGNDVWLALQSAVLAGSRVGDGGVLGVQAVLYNSGVGEHTLAFGNPIEKSVSIKN